MIIFPKQCERLICGSAQILVRPCSSNRLRQYLGNDSRIYYRLPDFKPYLFGGRIIGYPAMQSERNGQYRCRVRFSPYPAAFDRNAVIISLVFKNSRADGLIGLHRQECSRADQSEFEPIVSFPTKRLREERPCFLSELRKIILVLCEEGMSA